jgi:GntR family transcriptional regulator, transcriptional repressor for pyruvate dehydrogenase complex
MEREPLYITIIREIIGSVAAGRVQPGERLPAERELTRRFEVSRGTLRKALGELDRLGVVEIKPNSGVYVRHVSPRRLPAELLPPDFKQVSMDDVVDARLAIELAACRAACEKRSRADLDRLAGLIERMADDLDDLPAFLESDLAFHQTLVEASGNTVLVTAFAAIYEYHRFSSVYSSNRPGDQKLALDSHRRLLDALVDRNVRQAENALTDHLGQMKSHETPSGRSARPAPRRTRRKPASRTPKLAKEYR